MSTPLPKKITQLPVFTSLEDDDIFVVVEEDSGSYTTKRILASNLKSYFSGSTTGTRETKSASTTSLAVNSSADLLLSSVGKMYSLIQISTNVPAWVTLYTDATSRTNDATRNETTDPLPGTGVIAEVITSTGNLNQVITPAIVGWNSDSNVYAKVVNKSFTSSIVTVTLTYLTLEA